MVDGFLTDCQRFDAILASDRDLTADEVAWSERHFADCEEHRRQLADDEAFVGPRVKAFVKEMRDVYDEGVANGTPLADLLDLLRQAIRDNEDNLVDHIVTRCLELLPNSQAIEVLELAAQNVPESLSGAIAVTLSHFRSNLGEK